VAALRGLELFFEVAVDQEACFLVVDDESLSARSVARMLGRLGVVVIAGSCAEAYAKLDESQAWTALVVDLRLTDGTGLEVLAHARKRNVLAPALILSGALEPDAINRAFPLDARVLAKPCEPEHLRDWAREAMLASAEVPRRIAKAVKDLAVKHALTPAQTEILLGTVKGIDRADIMAARNVTENTHKTQVRAILRKTRTLSLGELRDRVLREVAGAV
jgi:DNA-binding NarL/FixJ family response regulator